MKDLKQASLIILVWLCLVSALVMYGWHGRPERMHSEWMPIDHTGQDVTDEATALWILEQQLKQQQEQQR